ncbi:dihydropteroate synthase [Ktedonobacteria bacterium brp13]|nr:dihydropteroate synthase [Ktedonobacteria bacterium brp13]
MGIVNVTPDSFSGDGLQSAQVMNGQETSTTDVIQLAVAQAQRFVAEGATFIDVGGESTRPGAPLISAQEESERVVPVIQALRAALSSDVLISIDTYKAVVADRALVAGADLVNDIWGLQKDGDMAAVIQQHAVPVILMANMRDFRKRDIVSDILRFLAHSMDDALAANIPWEHLIIDPGFGFGTTLEENLTMLRRLSELRVLGRPMLLGTSRKSSIGRVLGGLAASERMEGTAATVALGIAQGADIVRVHDVRAMARVVKMSDAVVRGVF